MSNYVKNSLASGLSTGSDFHSPSENALHFVDVYAKNEHAMHRTAMS